ncbi:uncharacterized protein LOC119571310 [Penaeus monodon]|uniref:uncharacterized protein LOC119571310 n=1 Tax=Penaeus monodon TaxID=6687 RepID=UPI0018A743B6|nr:uncharacterized protein LOC119571310 [Penaeus monodon]
MTRWGHELSMHNYELIYKPGKAHHVPDLLSRHVNPVDQENNPLLNPQNIAAEQRRDPLWNEMITSYRTLRAEALKYAHSDPTAAQPGIFRTYCRLRERFYFPGMLAETRRYVKSCVPCQRRKGLTRRAYLEHMPDVTGPFDRVSADLVDLHHSARGNRYVLVLIDHLTRFIQMIALPSKDAETVAEAILKEYLTLFGPPKALLTDRGKWHGRKGQPCDKGCLSHSQPGASRGLGRFAPILLNTSVHRSVKDTPLFLLTGRDLYFPVGNTNQQDVDETAAATYRQRLQAARETAVQTFREARRRWAQDHDGNLRRPHEFHPDDLVLVKENLTQQRGRHAALAVQ